MKILKIFFNYKNAYAWFMYPAVMYFPYKWVLFNQLRFLATPRYGVEKQNESLGQLFLVTFPLFTFFCFVVGIIIMSVNSVEYPNKKKKLLIRLVSIPDFVTQVKWVVYRSKKGTGLHIILKSEMIGSLFNNPIKSIDSTELKVPNWVKYYINCDEINVYEVNEKISSEGGNAHLYNLSSNTAYVNVFYKNIKNIPELT